MQTLSLSIDITDKTALPGQRHIAATAWLPAPETLGPRPTAIFTSPGGGYSRGYFDLQFPGRDGYSQAEHHVHQGLIVIAYDHLCVGESSIDDLERLTVEEIAAADDAAVRDIAERLEQGTLLAGYPELPDLVRIGMGQSMGGIISTIMQARHRSFAGLAVLGASPYTTLPQRDPAGSERIAAAIRVSRDTPPAALSMAEMAGQIPDFTYAFHWDDVPAELIAADMGNGYPQRKINPPWGSRTVPACALAMMAPGFFEPEAGQVEVPVLLAFGARDVSPDAHREPGFYRGSGDISLFVVPAMAHMHNFAGTRHLLWDRIVGWTRRVAEATLARGTEV